MPNRLKHVAALQPGEQNPAPVNRRSNLRHLTVTLSMAMITSISGCAAVQNFAGMASYDLVISNGRVMDPASGLDGIRYVGIRDGVIEAVSATALKGKREIDATGLVVAPGFIDLHAHDHSATTYRLHAQDGVTTALELEMGVYPVAKWYERRIGNATINFGASAAHGIARAIAFDAVNPEDLTGETHQDYTLLNSSNPWFKTIATDAQLDETTNLLVSEIEDGAIGLGFHLANTPGADHAEMIHFYGLAAKFNAPSFVHIRSVGQVTPSEAALEVVDATTRTGAEIHIVHLNSSALWETPQVLKIIEKAQADGLAITTEAYPYTGAASSIDDPRATEAGLKSFGIDFSAIELAATGERLTKETFYKYKRTKPRAATYAHIMKQSDVDLAFEHPAVMIASDGGIFIDGKGHPRGTGSFSRVFKRYVRERGNVGLMETIAKASYMPAQVISGFIPAFEGRGQIAENSPADITVFNADVIGDRATYQNPMQPSAGIAYVIVNGVPVVDDYEFIEDAKPGIALYGAGRK